MDQNARELEKRFTEWWTPERIISLGDNVFGFAMTLLILNLIIPPDLPSESLYELFLDWWAQFLTYFMSFIVLGTLWIGHHNIVSLIRRVDRKSIWLNIIFMSVVVLIPFTTAILRMHYEAQVAIAAYGFNLLVCGAMLYWFLSHAAKKELVEHDVTDGMVSIVKFRILVPMVGAVIVTLLGFISPILSLFLFAGLFFLVAVPMNSDRLMSALARSFKSRKV